MRRWKQIVLALLIASIALFYPLLAPTPHRIDQGHADLIVQGMTKEQVEAIFGVPAGQYDWAEESLDRRRVPSSSSIAMYWKSLGCGTPPLARKRNERYSAGRRNFRLRSIRSS